MEMKRVGEIMIPLECFPHIPYWFTLRQAMAEFGRTEARPDESGVGPADAWGLPCVIMVFSAQNELLGMLDSHDLFKGMSPNLMPNRPNGYREPGFDMNVDPDLLNMTFSIDKAMAALRRQVEQPVGDFLSPIEATVGYDDYILQTIYQMIDRNLNIIPVVRDGRIVGVVSALDALREMTKMLI